MSEKIEMYNLNLQNFNGPFDLLLKLLDEKKMDIKEVSLVAVTDQFINFIKTREGISIGDLAGFLVIAANLLFLKSKAILPSLEPESADEEESAEELKLKLERYREAQEMAGNLKELCRTCGKMYSRMEPKREICGFYPPENLTAEMLDQVFLNEMRDYEAACNKQVLPEESIQEIVSLEEKIMGLRELISQREKSSFGKFIEGRPKIEIVVSFLALLELIKQDLILIYQREEFGEIEFCRGGALRPPS